MSNLVNIEYVDDIEKFLVKHYSSSNSDVVRLDKLNNESKTLKDNLMDFELSRRNFHVPLNQINVVGTYSKEKYTDYVKKNGKEIEVEKEREYLSDLTLNWSNDELNKEFALTNGALDQWLRSRKDHFCSIAYWRTLTDPYIDGDMKIPLKVLLAQEVSKTHQGSDQFKIFREANFSFSHDRLFNGTENKGLIAIVGKDYPTFYSDYKFVDAFDNVLHDIGINTKYGHYANNDRGDIRFSWHITDKELIKEIEYAADSGKGQSEQIQAIRDIRSTVYKDNGLSTGLSYKNNYAGRGTLDFGLFSIIMVCSNGMISGWKRNLTTGIHHDSERIFVNDIIEKIIKLPKNIEDKFDIKIPEIMNTAYYLNHIDKLYEHMAKSSMLRVVNYSDKIAEMYSKATGLVLEDWRLELFKIVESNKKLGSDLMFRRLVTTAVNDPTIKLPKPKFEITGDKKIDHSVKKDNPSDYKSIVDTFTSLANYYDSIGSTAKSIELQMIGGKLLANAKPKTPYQVITV